jgi:leader peptidase (prepilin peptidase) / N-methyltransferase
MMPPMPLMYLAVALSGLLIGSFLNVCIYRLPRDQSIVWPASRCTSCGREIAWYENVPVLSYAALGGRCRTCGEPISLMYPLVEILTAVVFAATLAAFGLSWLLPVRLLFACAMIVLLVIDLQHQILPNEITLPGILVGLAVSVAGEPGWRDALIGAAAGGGLLWLVAWGYERVRHQEGLGFGDVKMLAMIGAFLGWKLMLLTLVSASLLGSLTAGVLIAARRADWQSKLPLGTFLAIAAIPVSLAGAAVVNWYAGFYR